MTADPMGMNRLEHYVSTAPFDPYSVEQMSPEQERYFMASQWRMMWWKLKRHRLAVLSAAILGLMYFTTLISEFLSPYALDSRHIHHIYAPPQSVHLFHEGSFVGPFVYGYDYELNMDTLQRVYTVDPTDVQPIRFFCRGDVYDFWGLFPADLHLMCPAEGGTLFLLGTDRLGRDMLSRLIHGGRLSLLMGITPVINALVIGSLLGIVAGFVGGKVNMVIMRTVDVFYAFPSVLLAIAISGALGAGLVNSIVSLTIVFIPPITRVAESVTTSVRNLDFVEAARASGAGSFTIIRVHVLGNVLGPVFVFATGLISVSIILASGLSFLGLGVRPPEPEWGLMLNTLRQSIYVNPWVCALPGVMIFITSICFNLMSDGLRAAMDVKS